MSSEMGSLFETLLEVSRAKSLPPVGKWAPSEIGEIDIKILRDGRWLHEQREIKRKEIVRLFSTILITDGADFFLITPVQKLKITVEDVPFLAIDFEVRGSGQDSDLLFKTNVDEHVLVSRENSIWISSEKPYLHVRSGLNALLTRNVYYRLVERGEEVEGEYLVHSCGQAFSLGSTA